MKKDYVLFENPDRRYSDYVAIKWNGGNSFTVFYLVEVENSEPVDGKWSHTETTMGGTYTAQELMRQIPYMNLSETDEKELRELLKLGGQ